MAKDLEENDINIRVGGLPAPFYDVNVNKTLCRAGLYTWHARSVAKDHGCR